MIFEIGRIERKGGRYLTVHRIRRDVRKSTGHLQGSTHHAAQRSRRLHSCALWTGLCLLDCVQMEWYTRQRVCDPVMCPRIELRVQILWNQTTLIHCDSLRLESLSSRRHKRTGVCITFGQDPITPIAKHAQGYINGRS